MLSTFTVTSTADTTATGTLRWAITESNDTTGPNTIDFDITNPTGDLLEIKLGSPLPSITTPVNIDGASQTGSSATSPLIQIDGTSAGSTAYGLQLQKSASGTATAAIQVSDLEITDFAAGGVFLNTASYVDLSGLFVGVQESSGKYLDEANTGYGVEFSQGTNDLLSASVVSANQGPGVILSDASSVTLAGDFIGTSATGEAFNDQNGNSLGNNGDGVLIGSSTTSSTVANTVVVNNSGQGVEITNSSTEHNQLTGDSIGSYLVGALSFLMPNQQNGVQITSPASDNTIGGTAAGSGNVIAGNDGDGVEITGSSATGNLVEGNDIGTNSNNAQLDNYDGVEIDTGASFNTVGGTTAAARNVISANSQDGVHIVGTGTMDNLVEGNYIGTTVNGSAALANHESGVAIYAQASANTIGGTVSAAANVLSGNTSNGVYISDSGTTGNVVDADYIGTNWNGTAAVSNNTGVVILSGATGNVIGGTATPAGDVISGNSGNGIEIEGNNTENNVIEGDDISGNSGDGVYISSAYNTVDGDTIGFNSSGVALFGATYNTIGGTTTAARDVITGNGIGVQIADSGTEHNVVEGDYLGVNAAGTATPNEYGVVIQLGASNNTIGGTSSSYRDVISGNSDDGVSIVSGATDNTVDGDYIGVGPGGSTSVGNGDYGVYIYGSTFDTVGGSVVGSGNVISGNGQYGVYISGPTTYGNTVAANDIGTTANGAAPCPMARACSSGMAPTTTPSGARPQPPAT